MGIKCEIRTYKDTEVFNAGDIVSGIINYDIEEETSFKKITISLKGNGYLIVKNKEKGDNYYTNRRREDYVDVDYIIHKNENGEKLKGSYQKEFNFVLPELLPKTLRISKKTAKHYIYCHIMYYVRMKFEIAGVLTKIRKFSKEIIVNSVVKPKLATEPIVYGEQRNVSQLSWKRNIIKYNAVVDNSVRMPRDKIKIDFEIANDSNFNIKEVVVKLVELYTFKASRRKVTIHEEVKGTDSRTGSILHGQSENRSAEITIPELAASIEYSHLISREYFITISIILLKHKDDIVFKIPVQVTNDKPPPAYWKVLQESNDELNEHVGTWYEEFLMNSDVDDDDVTVTTL